MVPLVDSLFIDENINEHVTILTLKYVTRLTKYWVTLLYTLIMECLAHFNGDLRFNFHANTLLQKHMPTINAFESLIEFSLFGCDFGEISVEKQID